MGVEYKLNEWFRETDNFIIISFHYNIFFSHNQKRKKKIEFF